MAEQSKLAKELFDAIAAEAGWPEDVTSQVRVTMNPKGINLSYDDALDEQIFDLEYGKFQQPPRAAMRKFKHRASGSVDEVLFGNLNKRLKDKGVL